MVKVHLYHSVSSAIPSLIDTIFKYLLDKLNKMKFLLCNGPISIKTSDGKTLKVNWDVGQPDQTIRSMFVVSIKEDGGDGENTTLLSNKKATGPKFKKEHIWNGSSWMQVDQPAKKKATGPKFKKEHIWNGSSWMEVDQPEPVFQKANTRVQNWLGYINKINILKVIFCELT